MTFWCSMFLFTGLLLMCSNIGTFNVRYLSGVGLGFIGLTQFLFNNNIFVYSNEMSYILPLIAFSLPIFLHSKSQQKQQDIVVLLVMILMVMWEVNHFIYYLYSFEILPTHIDEPLNLLFFFTIIFSSFEKGVFSGGHIKTITNNIISYIRDINPLKWVLPNQ